jgi:succinate-semialdehyde dehydrogenase/glutarate-semialdehyde dehydrogenase
MAIESINPATEEVLATFDEASPSQIERALAEAQTDFRAWRQRPFRERGAVLRKTAAYLRANRGRLGHLATLEMGKPIAQAEAEVEKCAWVCEYYAEHAEGFLSNVPSPTNASKSYVAFEPMGIILAVMPWNYPFWQVIRAAAPALMAGNAMILKHASNVPQCALAAEEVFRESGFPRGIFRTLLLSARGVEGLIADHRVRAVTLTGSDIAGAHVAEMAGRYLKKCVLELGGADPYIVLDDADLQAAARVGALARCQNTGQSCIAAKRFIVHEAVAEEFERLFAEEMAKLKVGDPLLADTQIGPLARGDMRDELDRQVRGSIEQGARVVVGGRPVEGKGYFYEPTVLSNVNRDMPVWREETFGPAAPVLRVRDELEAVEAANDSQFGLGASVWTQDPDRGQWMARWIESGQVFVNGMVASDPRLPFGGVKRSGYGRELGAELGIREFVNVQAVWIGPAVGPQMPQSPSAAAE